MTAWRQKQRAGAAVAAVIIALLGANMVNASDHLREYVHRADDAFEFEVVRTMPLGNADGYMLRLTSQKWRDITWTHWLTVVVPHERDYPDKALLVVEGGRNRAEPPTPDAGLALILAYLSQQTGAAAAVLQQVPNQPLMGGRYEDDLIAYTFDRYLETGDAEYPLLLPMVRSVAAAMDALTQWSSAQYEQGIESFFVAGASKRGWTTWLAAAADERVSGIAPMVIDMVNIRPQMQRQLRTYGRYSHMIQDYVQHDVLERIGTERGAQLMEMVDPYCYRQAITVPKLIVLGTNDPYWTVDAANLYVPEMAGPTYLHYSPNAGHDLNADSQEDFLVTLSSIASFIRRHFGGMEMPRLDWRHDAPGKLVVEWDDEGALAVLWSARSPNRDFRAAQWQAEHLPGTGRAEVNMTPPAEGWQAWFVEVRFGGAYPLRLSTTMTVLPEEFPYDM